MNPSGFYTVVGSDKFTRFNCDDPSVFIVLGFSNSDISDPFLEDFPGLGKMDAVCGFFSKFGKPTDVSMGISKNAAVLCLFILYAQQFVLLAEVGFSLITGKNITSNLPVNLPGNSAVFGTNQFSSSINPSKSKQA